MGISEVNNIIETYTFLQDKQAIFGFWKQLIENYEVSGKAAHDTRIIAFMQSYSIKKLYTLNRGDFDRFKEIIELV